MTARAIGAAVVPPGAALVLEHDRDGELRRALLVGRGEGDEPGRVLARDARLAGAGLAADRVAGDLRGSAGPALDRQSHHLPDLVRRLAADRAPDQGRPLLDDRLPLRRHDAVHDLRLHEPAADADRACDHRHLQRRDEHPLLPERHSPGVDVGVHLRVVEAPALVEAADAPLVRGGLERRQLVEAEALRLLEDALRPELLPDVAEDRVHRVRRARPRGRPSRTGSPCRSCSRACRRRCSSPGRRRTTRA